MTNHLLTSRVHTYPIHTDLSQKDRVPVKDQISQSKPNKTKQKIRNRRVRCRKFSRKQYLYPEEEIPKSETTTTDSLGN